MRFIPKTIHMIWFGRNPYPPIVKKCMKSWKRYCPDYKVKIWNEDNFDVFSCSVFVKEAYQAGKWAFVSDYVRLYALYQEGGVYIDSDVELLRGLDEILENEHAVTGYSSSCWIPAGLMASEKGNPWILDLMKYYNGRHFVLEDGSYDMKVNNAVISELSAKKYGFRPGDYWIAHGNVRLYPRTYFHPYAKKAVNWEKDDIRKVKSYYKIDREHTHCVHYGTGTWVSNRNTMYYRIKHFVRSIFPQPVIEAMERVYYRHHHWNRVK